MQVGGLDACPGNLVFRSHWEGPGLLSAWVLGGMGMAQKEAGATAQGSENEASPDGEEGMACQQASTGHHLHPQPFGK